MDYYDDYVLNSQNYVFTLLFFQTKSQNSQAPKNALNDWLVIELYALLFFSSANQVIN